MGLSSLEGTDYYKVVTIVDPYRDGSGAKNLGEPGSILGQCLFFEGASESSAWKLFELACADERVYHVELYHDSLGRRTFSYPIQDRDCRLLAVADLRYRYGLTGYADTKHLLEK